MGLKQLCCAPFTVLPIGLVCAFAQAPDLVSEWVWWRGRCSVGGQPLPFECMATTCGVECLGVALLCSSERFFQLRWLI